MPRVNSWGEGAIFHTLQRLKDAFLTQNWKTDILIISYCIRCWVFLKVTTFKSENNLFSGLVNIFRLYWNSTFDEQACDLFFVLSFFGVQLLKGEYRFHILGYFCPPWWKGNTKTLFHLISLRNWENSN